ncbi:MAG: cache domain-containing protein [Bacteriovoracaceae bacterium]|nr:cache domain-containing protein [Bacteriovoracaceae bacterium]
MRSLLFLMCLLVSSSAFSVKITKQEVVDLVEKTCAEIQKTANYQDVLNKITAAEHPYKDKDNPAKYVFAYDDKVNIIAHPKKNLVGKNYHNKPDVRGNKFRDSIVNGALKNGTGWAEYYYKKPGAVGIKKKNAYYKLCSKGDVKIILASGRYAE